MLLKFINLSTFSLQETYPGAWPSQDRQTGTVRHAHQVGKIIKTNMMRIVRQRKQKDNFTKCSGEGKL